MSAPDTASPDATTEDGKAEATPGARVAARSDDAAYTHLVDLVDLAKSFGPVRAVDGISLHIDEGEFFSLLGPSGSGKTTLLNLIGGFEQPTSGAVLIDGNVVNDLPPFRRPVNTVFQNYALFPHMSVGRNVAYPLQMARLPRGERVKRVREALDTVGLVGFEPRRPAELSGGQRQRVALARALVGRPRLLLLDEPLGALDLQLRQQMQTMLKHLQRTVAITFVYVTHDQGEALAMSDRIAVVSSGKVEQIGTPREIYDRPTTRFVASFIGRTNFLQVERDAAGHCFILGRQVLRESPDPDAAGTTLAVRPERVALGVGAAARQNVFEGHVVETVYMGESLRVIVDLVGAPHVEASVPAGSGAFENGERIRVGWNDADSVLVSD